MIVWRGWGILVPLIVMAAFVPFSVLSVALFPANSIGEAVTMPLGGLIGAGIIWLVARKIESGPSRTLVEPATGREFVIKPDAGSLFFVPTRYWPFIIGGFSVIFTLGAIAAAKG